MMEKVNYCKHNSRSNNHQLLLAYLDIFRIHLYHTIHDLAPTNKNEIKVDTRIWIMVSRETASTDTLKFNQLLYDKKDLYNTCQTIKVKIGSGSTVSTVLIMMNNES